MSVYAGARQPGRGSILRPGDVVDAIWDALPAAPGMMMLPAAVRFSTFLRGVLPLRAFDAVVGRKVGVCTSMEGFTGRP
jgi:all-trans-retinol dehydrogenase (NAD+)